MVSNWPSRVSSVLLMSSVRLVTRWSKVSTYWRIESPTFEHTELFERSVGEATDIVRKEMFSFTDQGDRGVTLRPEGTAPICRAYVEHGLHREPQPQKLYTIAPMYRYGAPGRGRYREHWQLSVEAIGTDEVHQDDRHVQHPTELMKPAGTAPAEDCGEERQGIVVIGAVWGVLVADHHALQGDGEIVGSGLETTAERRAAGKSERGCIRLSAYHEGGQIVIEVADDGCGMTEGATGKPFVSRMAIETPGSG